MVVCLVKQGNPGEGSRSEGKMNSVLDMWTLMMGLFLFLFLVILIWSFQVWPAIEI